jgi:quercetin dioxygenase-like cupin family protein
VLELIPALASHESLPRTYPTLWKMSTEPDQAQVVVVFFDAGARTRPHIHPTDQVLHFISGRGFVAFPGEEEQEVEEGRVFIVPGGALHMHGATNRGAVRHLAVRAAGKTNWDPALPAEWRSWGKLQ